MDFFSRNVGGMISSGEIHPDLQEMSGRDDFQRGKFILNCRKSLVGMISVGEIDPDMQKSSWRDDFQRGNAS